jgi:hypothetical protein
MNGWIVGFPLEEEDFWAGWWCVYLPNIVIRNLITPANHLSSFSMFPAYLSI